MPGPYTTDRSWQFSDADILPPGELDITDIQRSIGKGAGEQGYSWSSNKEDIEEDYAAAEEEWGGEVSELIDAVLQVGKKPDYKKGTADTWSEYAPEGGKVRFAGEGRVVELAREPDANWPPFWWGESEQYLQDNVDAKTLSPVNKSELKSRYHEDLKELREESAEVRTRISGNPEDHRTKRLRTKHAYKHVPFDQYGGPILIGFDGETPVMPSEKDLGGYDSPGFAKRQLIARMQFKEAMYRATLVRVQQRPFQKASGRVDPTAGPLDLLGFGLGAVKAGSKGTQALVKSFLKKQRGPVPMLPAGDPRLGVPMHPRAELDSFWSSAGNPRAIKNDLSGKDRAFNISGHSRPGFGFSDPRGGTWRPTPKPGREWVRGRPTGVLSADITPEQAARRAKDFRQTGGFYPSGPRQYFVDPYRYPKPATRRAAIDAKYEALSREPLPMTPIGYKQKMRRDMEILKSEQENYWKNLSKVSPQELERRRSMFERLGYWNTAIPATLATPEMANQMQELDEYGDALRMLEDLQHGGE
tara:strand:- start:2220 stop:3809 length:1590 start_codon:yes stop_codon:yes gene_type:complete